MMKRKSILLKMRKEIKYSILQQLGSCSNYSEYQLWIFFFIRCPPCKAIGPIFEKLSKDPDNSNIAFVKIDIDNFPDSSAKYMIRSVPTFVFLAGEKKVSQVYFFHWQCKMILLLYIYIFLSFQVLMNFHWRKVFKIFSKI